VSLSFYTWVDSNCLSDMIQVLMELEKSLSAISLAHFQWVLFVHILWYTAGVVGANAQATCVAYETKMCALRLLCYFTF
jgi:hypothetical protein